jgi:hypothetical protein
MSAKSFTSDLTDAQYELADKISAFLETQKDAAVSWAPSAVAKRVRCTTNQARTVLQWMAAHHEVLTSGNGAWTRYEHRPLHTPLA